MLNSLLSTLTKKLRIEVIQLHHNILVARYRN